MMDIPPPPPMFQVRTDTCPTFYFQETRNRICVVRIFGAVADVQKASDWLQSKRHTVFSLKIPDKVGVMVVLAGVSSVDALETTAKLSSGEFGELVLDSPDHKMPDDQ